ncbi:hypothetical protein BUALT_Bualt07G0137600 [Buddleja alternifolia]|uniref:F-box domain-containing protein n=1 Tax=Buddleja alternifolia TaxID=168488 RepID=A0AAV6XBV5_9LAMI|nr:hypothetical protein BUALT_Bualt07G0137600 [Buddleja alternifolia]
MRMDLIPGLPNDLGLEGLIRIDYQDFSSVASVCRSWNRLIELPEFWRRRKASGLTRKVVVMAQCRVDPVWVQEWQFYELKLYEPETGYRALLPPPVPGGLPISSQLVGVGLNLVVMGGLNPNTSEVMTDDVFVYNFVAATWHRGAKMPGHNRWYFACASDSNRMVFVAGGHDDKNRELKSAMAYDVAEDKWMVLPDMARERDESKGVFHHGKFLVIGGYSKNQHRFGITAESFDIATWQWDPVQEGFLNSETCYRHCTDDGDGKLFKYRGDYVEALQGSTWQLVAKLPTRVKDISYMIAWQGKVLVIGSVDGEGELYKSFVLDLKSSKWESVEKEYEFLGHVESGCCLEL